MPRRIKYPNQAAYAAYVVLPDEWRGEHLLRRDMAVRAAAKLGNNQITLAAIALCLVDAQGGIPGVEGTDPAAWDFKRVPLALLVWLEQAVFNDFAQVFIIPKALPPVLSDGSTATAETNTAGSSAPTP